MIYVTRTSIHTYHFDTGEDQVVPVRNLVNAVAVDYDISSKCGYWADIHQDTISVSSWWPFQAQNIHAAFQPHAGNNVDDAGVNMQCCRRPMRDGNWNIMRLLQLCFIHIKLYFAPQTLILTAEKRPLETRGQRGQIATLHTQ